MAAAKDICLVDGQGRRFGLSASVPVRIGRAADNTIVLPDPTVSQHHAVIAYENGIPHLRDRASSNGTFVNDVKVDVAALTSDCEIRFGSARLDYRRGSAIPISSPHDCPDCGTANNTAAAFCTRCGATLTNAKRSLLAVVAGIGVLAIILGLGHAIISGSKSSSINSASQHSSAGFANMFAAQNDYPLPGASSDFIGDWCGWDRVANCQPEGSCEDDQAPDGVSFTGGAGGPVTLHAELMGSPNLTVSAISVNSEGPHTVRLRFTETISDPAAQTSRLADINESLVSADAATVTDTEIRTAANDPSITETRRAELHRCTENFSAMAEQWYKQRKLVERGKLEGKLSQ